MHLRANALTALIISLCYFGAAMASGFGFYTSPGFPIGSTYMDAQHNSRMARQIVAGGGWVHNAWTYLPGPSNTNRLIQYYAWQMGGAGTVFNADVDSSIGAGFTSIDFDPLNGGAAVIGYHQIAAGGTRFSRDSGNAAGSFSPRFTFPSANCQGIVSGVATTEGAYIWPSVAIDVDGSGNSILHAVSTEYASITTDPYSIVYYRSNPGISGAGATCGQWIDSVKVVTATVVADPGSDRVALVYLVPADNVYTFGISQRNQDVVYRESSDLGTSWGPVINITNYTGADKERAFADVSAIFTTDGCLHISWAAGEFDSATQTASSQCKLYHWDECGQCKTVLRDAMYENNCSRGAWQMNICKMNLSECTVEGSNRLYVTYTQFLGSETGIPGQTDCSQSLYSNGELFMQASSTNGQTWGPAINLSNTFTPNCAAGECASENWSSSAMYVSDSLRIQYIVDLDAGQANISEGTWTDNLVMNMSAPCVEMALYASLSLTPTAFLYPFAIEPTQDTTVTFLMQNSGSAAVNYTRSIEYLNGSGWLNFPAQPATGSISAGCISSNTATMVATGPAVQGLFKARVHYVYDSGFGIDTTTLPIDLYNFEILCDPPPPTIRTSCARLHVDQTARVANQDVSAGFTYFEDGSNFLYDGSLILGTAADNMSWSIFKPNHSSCGEPPNVPGILIGLAPLSFDSTSNPRYRRISGKGTNRDSTVGYSVDYYAPKHPDSCDFFVAHFKLYKGSNNPTGTVTNLTVGFACDWDVPTDTGSDNYGGFDESRQMLYQKGANFSGSAADYGAMAAYRAEDEAIVGGFIWDSEAHIYPNVDYVASELWNEMESLSAGEYTTTSQLEDLNSILTIYRDATINGAASDTLKFVVILAAVRNATYLGAIQGKIDRGFNFAVDYGLIDRVFCKFGDADNNGLHSISDAVYMINYIFAGGPPPVSPCLGDADCNCILTISDVVYLINYIFSAGPPPECVPPDICW